MRVAARKKQSIGNRIQPKLVLPKGEGYESAEDDALVRQYVKIGESALKNSSLKLGDEEPAA